MLVGPCVTDPCGCTCPSRPQRPTLAAGKGLCRGRAPPANTPRAGYGPSRTFAQRRPPARGDPREGGPNAGGTRRHDTAGRPQADPRLRRVHRLRVDVGEGGPRPAHRVHRAPRLCQDLRRLAPRDGRDDRIPAQAREPLRSRARDRQPDPRRPRRQGAHLRLRRVAGPGPRRQGGQRLRRLPGAGRARRRGGAVRGRPDRLGGQRDGDVTLERDAGITLQREPDVTLQCDRKVKRDADVTLQFESIYQRKREFSTIPTNH